MLVADCVLANSLGRRNTRMAFRSAVAELESARFRFGAEGSPYRVSVSTPGLDSMMAVVAKKSGSFGDNLVTVCHEMQQPVTELASKLQCLQGVSGGGVAELDYGGGLENR